MATFTLGGKDAFFVLFDATEIPQGDAVSWIYIYDDTNFKAVLDTMRVDDINPDDLAAWQDSFFSSFVRRVRPVAKTLQHHLTDFFGEARAPSRLKPEEVKNGDMVSNSKRRPYYEAEDKSLDELFPDIAKDPGDYAIWVIDHEGSLIIGREIDLSGHPTLTDAKPARVGGELRKDKKGWFINSQSGRYSRNYQNANALLENALGRFRSVFYRSRDKLRAEYYNPLSKVGKKKGVVKKVRSKRLIEGE